MQIGFGRLRLTSAQFWAMTPREIACLFSPGEDRPRIDLARLMQLYPDKPQAEETAYE
jgi:uncharacterized phage protein (TIGR02216 family)